MKKGRQGHRGYFAQISPPKEGIGSCVSRYGVWGVIFPHPLERFHTRETTDESGYSQVKAGDEKKYEYVAKGDPGMTSFQCDCLVFYLLTGRRSRVLEQDRV